VNALGGQRPIIYSAVVTGGACGAADRTGQKMLNVPVNTLMVWAVFRVRIGRFIGMLGMHRLHGFSPGDAPCKHRYSCCCLTDDDRVINGVSAPAQPKTPHIEHIDPASISDRQRRIQIVGPVDMQADRDGRDS
jgi:hypothetical protein